MFLTDPKNAYCVDCLAQGRRMFAQVVDHVIPHQGDLALFWDRRNWAPRCASCHNRKTATVDGGFGRSATKSLPIAAPETAGHASSTVVDFKDSMSPIDFKRG
jgi:5-methylcytosine-specific restriction endonuclease McrA